MDRIELTIGISTPEHATLTDEECFGLQAAVGRMAFGDLKSIAEATAVHKLWQMLHRYNDRG